MLQAHQRDFNRLQDPDRSVRRAALETFNKLLARTGAGSAATEGPYLEVWAIAALKKILGKRGGAVVNCAQLWFRTILALYKLRGTFPAHWIISWYSCRPCAPMGSCLPSFSCSVTLLRSVVSWPWGSFRPSPPSYLRYTSAWLRHSGALCTPVALVSGAQLTVRAPCTPSCT